MPSAACVCAGNPWVCEHPRTPRAAQGGENALAPPPCSPWSRIPCTSLMCQSLRGHPACPGTSALMGLRGVFPRTEQVPDALGGALPGELYRGLWGRFPSALTG